MRIASSNLQFGSQHGSLVERTRKETIHAWVDDDRQIRASQAAPRAALPLPASVDATAPSQRDEMDVADADPKRVCSSCCSSA